MADSLLNFVSEVNDSIQDLLNETGTPVQAFTKYVLDEIAEKTNIGDPNLCYATVRSSNGSILGEINAYAISYNGETVSLFYTIWKGQAGLPTVKNDEYKQAIARLQGFYSNAVKGIHKNLEPSAEHYALCKTLYERQEDICNIRLFVLSDGIISNSMKEPKCRIHDKHIEFPTWDLNKLYMNSNTASDHESIDIDLLDDPEFKYELPYIEMKNSGDKYQCMLVMVPGRFLYNLYENYNTNLLQNNVRFFLGFKGKKSINAEILATLRQRPQRFLAYNNGITATAQDVLLENGKIAMIQDFQILNGGQTTASIFYSKKLERKDRPETYVDLSKVFVQMKLLILKENVREIISDITLYSNSQNKVKTADYTTNNQFNLAMQELSRTTYTPDTKNDGNLTQWYYERVRGQFEESLKNCDAVTRSQFLRVHPRKQIFKKELLAKVWQGWNQFPYYVCLGDQGNYNKFISAIIEDKRIPDLIYYQDTIALIILYNYMQKESEVFKSFHQIKAQMIGYTMASLNYITSSNLSLNKIWIKQGLSDSLISFIDALATSIYEKMTKDCPVNVTFRDFAKNKNTWDLVSKYSHHLDFGLIADDLKAQGEDEQRRSTVESSVNEESYQRIIGYGSKFWSGLTSESIDFLDQTEKSQALEILEAMSKDRILTEGQISFANAILAKFEESGLSVDSVKEKSSLINDKTQNKSFTVYQRIVKLSDSDWKAISILASRVCEPNQARAISRLANMRDRKKAKPNELALVNEALDIINKRFNKEF